MKVLIIILVCVLGFLCVFSLRDKRSTEVKIAHRIMQDVSNLLHKRYGLTLAAIKEGGDKNEYRLIGLSFDKNGELDKDKGRIVLVDCANTLLEAINADEEFKKYLPDGVFTIKNIEVSIYIVGKTGGKVFHPHIGIFSLVDGTIQYLTKSPEQEFGYHTIEEETFEEAVRIIASERDGRTN